MLISFGLDSAADVTPAKVQPVPNIGPKLAARLYQWRASLEKSFRFDPNRKIDRTEIDKIDREIAGAPFGIGDTFVLRGSGRNHNAHETDCTTPCASGADRSCSARGSSGQGEL